MIELTIATGIAAVGVVIIMGLGLWFGRRHDRRRYEEAQAQHRRSFLFRLKSTQPATSTKVRR